MEAANLSIFSTVWEHKEIRVLSLQKITGGHETAGGGLDQNWGLVPPRPGHKTATGCSYSEIVIR